jgi:predicted TIM-barrel fold metal-dependent hydrolase
MICSDAPPGLLADSSFRRGFVWLRRYGLSFDAWLYHPQIEELADLARTFPEVTIVLNHIGGPLGIGPDAGKREQVVSGLEHRYLCASDLSKCRREVRRAWLRALWIRPAESYRTAYVD